MQNKSLIFWLFNSNKKALYEDTIVREATNYLKPNGQPAHLQHAPDGWKDSLVKYGRNMKWLGVFRDFTVPLNFKKDGARIVKEAMWKNGMEAILYLAIHKLNRTVYPPKFETWYSGELDFSKFDQKKSNIVLNVMEGGMSKYLKAYEGTPYQIPVDADPEAKVVIMDGLPFSNKIEYELFAQSFQPDINNSKTYTIGAGIISQEGSTQGILNLDSEQIELTDNGRFMHDYDKYITANVSGKVKVFTHTSPTKTMNPHIYLRKSNSVTGAQTDYIINNGVVADNTNFVFSYNFSIPLQPNDRLYLNTFIEHDPDPFAPSLYEITAGSMLITYEVTFRQTFIKGITPIRLLQKLVEKMTDGRYTARSNYLSAMDDLLITSGSAIRNHEGETHTVSGSFITTSLDDFFQALNIRGIGLGIENDVLIIENKKYFFKDDVVINFGEVNSFEVAIADDIVFNTIKSGYPNQTYDSVNGLDEPNVTQNYTTPHTRIVSELDLTSPYRADAYGIELMRVNLDGQDTTDNSSDNDTFFLNVKKGGTYVYYSGNLNYNVNGVNTITIPVEFLGNPSKITIVGTVNNGTYTITNISYLLTGNTILTVAETLNDGTENVVINTTSDTLYQLNRPAFTSITGLLHPTKMFNVLLSPHTNLLNNTDYIHSILDFQDLNFVKFQAGDKNSDMSYTINGVTITEKSDVQIGSMPKKLFRPYYFSFSVPTDYNFLKTIKASPYSKLSFTYNGFKYYGYLVDGGVKPASRDVQTIKLLCAPETDLSQLINMP